MNMMIVDDSATLRKIVTVALKPKGFNFIEAENGQDALNKLPAQKVDFFVVDVNMPVMNGISFIKEVRKLPDYGKTPIVILTTESEENLKNEGKAAGANAWIIKPFVNDDFIALISKLGG